MNQKSVMLNLDRGQVKATLSYLRACQAYRARGGKVSFTDDPSWLVTMAINRKAGWPDDPSFSRGSAMPVNGQYPKKASGDYYQHLRLIANEINTPRLIVREGRLGELRKFFHKHLPSRITWLGGAA